MKKKSLITLVMAFLLALVMAAQMPMTAFAAAVPKYISEMLIVSATDANQAKSKLGGGYEVLSTPLYEGTHEEDGKKVTTKTFLAYKITTDPDDAIVDIKAMNMYGGYSYGEYAEYLEKQKAITQQLVDGLKEAIVEFQETYNDDKPGAVYAEEMLRYFYYDDLDMTVSDLFLDYNVKNGDDSALVTLFMQGNVDVIEDIENLLMIACADKGDYSFLEILDKKAEDTSEIGYDMPTETEYAENVADLLNTLIYVQYPIRFYNKCEKENPLTEKIEAEYARQQKLIDDYIEKHPEEDEKDVVKKFRAENSDTVDGKALKDYESYINGLTDEQNAFMAQGKAYSDVLRSTRYPGDKYETLYDLIMAHDVSDENERKEYKVAEFDALMRVMTAGQRGLLKVGFAQLLSSAMIDTNSYGENLNFARGENLSEEEYDNSKDNLLPHYDEVQISVFEGVDRTLYDADGIAMTSEAITLQSRNENASMGGGFMSEKTQKIMGYVTVACSAVALVTSTYLIAATMIQRSAILEATARATAEAAAVGRTAIYAAARLKAVQEVYTGILDRLGVLLLKQPNMGEVTLFTEEIDILYRESGRFAQLVPELEEASIAASRSASTSAAAAARKTVASPLKTAFSQVLSRAMGMIFFIIDIACLVEMVIELIIFLVKLVKKPTTDAPYQAIPRVLCSAETVYNGHLDGDGKRIYEDDYVFYYGVKNPEIDTTKTDPSGNLKKYAIADIYDWSLKGEDREWIALYTTKDRRMGNPIKADSLAISYEASVLSKQTVKYFHREDTCNTVEYYQIEKRNYTDITNTYIHFATMTDDEMKSLSGSVFADGKSMAFGCGGLVIGAVGGAVVTGIVKKKKVTDGN